MKILILGGMGFLGPHFVELATARQHTVTLFNRTWVSQEFLLANGVSPWTELPLWVADDPEHAGFSRVSNARAVSIGLYCRPFADTAGDTLNWARTVADSHKWGAGLDAEKEKRLLAAWKQRQSWPASAPAAR